MRSESDARRWKIAQLSKRAVELIKTARLANAREDVLQWRIKVLEAFLLVDLAWKIASGRASPSDEEQTYKDFESLQATMKDRIKAITRKGGSTLFD